MHVSLQDSASGAGGCLSLSPLASNLGLMLRGAGIPGSTERPSDCLEYKDLTKVAKVVKPQTGSHLTVRGQAELAQPGVRQGRQMEASVFIMMRSNQSIGVHYPKPTLH